MSNDQQPWYRGLTSYHWLVLAVCTMGWSFDCMNQQIFNLSRKPAMSDLLAVQPTDPTVALVGSWTTAALLIGWATGGIFFGILGDRIGRVKTYVIMILCFTVCTGLCGLSLRWWDYLIYCFLTGFGAGGIFPVGCTLVAESVPDRTRPHALGMLQAFSASGNITAGLLFLLMIALWSRELIGSPWRWLFAVGILPALLSIIVVRKLREPEAWTKAVGQGKDRKRAGSIKDLFGDPRWRPRAIVGMVLAASGVIGLWGIGVFSNDLTQTFIGRQYDDAARSEGQADKDLQFVVQLIAKPEQLDLVQDKIVPRDLLGTTVKDADASVMYRAAVLLRKEGKAVSADAVLAALDQPAGSQTADDRARRSKLLQAPATAGSPTEHVDRILARQKTRGIKALQWAAVTLIMFNVGAFFGMYAFARVTHLIGRRLTFLIFFFIAAITTSFAFLFMSKPADLFWMVPLMGAAQLSVFGGFAIYFPELFPTRLRSTGTSFCYNVGRYVAATGPLGLGLLTKYVFVNTAEPFRYAGVAMCSCFVVGMVALVWAPETRGQPLPE